MPHFARASVVVLLLVVLLVAIGAILYYVGLKYRATDDCRVLRRIPTDNGTIEIVNASCKEGLPHTTDSQTIRMTESEYAAGHRETTLTHERVHLDQKRNPAAWRDFYNRAWGYELVKAGDLPTEYVKNLRPNPDTADAPWALWRGRWLFFPNYSADRTLLNARILVWDTELKEIVSPPSEWTAMFCGTDGCPRQFEHPHELSAEYIAEGHTSPAALKLFAWKH
jgi:hypothetical protein